MTLYFTPHIGWTDSIVRVVGDRWIQVTKRLIYGEILTFFQQRISPAVMIVIFTFSIAIFSRF